MLKKNRTKAMVKEAFDNLPSGICFFSENGIPVLCNRQMHRLVFALTGRDLQMLSDLTSALEALPASSTARRDKDNYFLPDGSVWRFRRQAVRGESVFTEYIATEVTELYRNKQELEKSTKEHERVVESLRSISRNVIDITREEEILAMKMQVHSELGIALQKLRHFRRLGCPPEEKEGVAAELENALRFLTEGIGKSDSRDELLQTMQMAESLGVAVDIEGEPPKEPHARELLILALRECVTNTLRHASGSKVFVRISEDARALVLRFTNNGRAPEGPITEGGGLGALRRQTLRAGGRMEIESAQEFALTLRVPKETEGRKGL